MAGAASGVWQGVPQCRLRCPRSWPRCGNGCSRLPAGRSHAIFCAILYGVATVEELVNSAVEARRVARNAIALAVREARADGWSWDKISAALGGTPNGETLRRHFSGEKGTAP